MFRPQKFAQMLQSFGFCECMPEHMGPQVLRITLVRATNIRHRGSFYFEVWSEPSEGYPKNSRVHTAVSGAADLGCETLEIDWYGDEQELVLHVVEYNGSKQSKDLPVGEVRVPRESVLRYAKEAAQADELHRGTRVVQFASVEKHEAILRRRRFQDMFLPGDWFTAIVARVGAEQGLHIPKAAEVEELRKEIECLRTENASLKSSIGGPMGESIADDRMGSLMGVAVRFELVPRRLTTEFVNLRQASFQ